MARMVVNKTLAPARRDTVWFVSMATVDLSTLSWTLFGWRPNHAVLTQSMETGAELHSEIGPIPATVPGSVARALRDAGMIEDWHYGTKSRECEWIEHRDWQFRAVMPAGMVKPGRRAVLIAEGLDYRGQVFVDSTSVSRFEGALVPHRFDLTDFLSDGRDHVLSLLFEPPPPEQGQIGRTSESTYFKPRYNYEWDWSPRHVPIGIWQPLRLETELSAGIHVWGMRSTLHTDNAHGDLGLNVNVDDAARDQVTRLSLTVNDGDHRIGRVDGTPTDYTTRLELSGASVEPWWPNGEGAQKLYTVRLEASGRDQSVLWEREYRIGFKRVDWEPVEGLPQDARDWICVVNGRRIFMQGVNWTPIRTNYPDITTADYERLMDMYVELGCNTLRVWGGGYLESEAFFDACDRNGLLVWQEFPLSSSGIENEPPRGTDAITTLARIAESYIHRRGRHTSLMVWCGGNELQAAADGSSNDNRPVDRGHPCIAALEEVCTRLDPSRRFVETSPSGPRFSAQSQEFGTGVHHHVHGPWGLGQFNGQLHEWNDYFTRDDAGFRTEVGMPGPQSMELMEKYSGPEASWPPTSSWWRHASPWWTQWEVFEPLLAGLTAREALRKYIEAGQDRQAQALSHAAEACKRRFPRCAGFLVWHGHDCFPCPSNNSIIDFERNPKPAFYALQRVFGQSPGPER